MALDVATYWRVAPLVGIGLSGFGWLALWITRPGKPEIAPKSLKP